ncbi:MAG: arginine repressor, partial [Cyanobacteriota bacterium]
YFGERYTGKRLADVLDLCDGMALVHNLEASERHLLHGGYGPLGLCIDSAALLQQALEGRCQVFPVLLGGIWRERLLKRSQRVLATAPLGEGQRRTLEGYQRALGALPYDGFLQGAGAAQALERLRACQPSSSPFVLVGALAQPKPSCRG